MLPILQDRICRVLIIAGILFAIIAYVIPTKDRFVMDNGGHNSIITRQDDPLIYWGAESAVVFVSVSLFAAAIYRGRKK
jgi:hypothetical protein